MNGLAALLRMEWLGPPCSRHAIRVKHSAALRSEQEHHRATNLMVFLGSDSRLQLFQCSCQERPSCIFEDSAMLAIMRIFQKADQQYSCICILHELFFIAHLLCADISPHTVVAQLGLAST